MQDVFSRERWPSIRDLALSLGATPRQTQKWKDRDRIPGDWHLQLLEAAEREDVLLRKEELLSMTSRSAA